MMVGRPVSFTVDKTAGRARRARCWGSTGVTMLDDNDEMVLDDVSLRGALRARSSASPACRATARPSWSRRSPGSRGQNAGKITFAGEDISHASVRDRHFRGMAHIPEDRHRMGMIDSFTIAENMVLNSYYDEAYAARFGSINWRRVHETAAAFCVDFDVRTPSRLPARPASLSGGNQQKMVVARELERADQAGGREPADARRSTSARSNTSTSGWSRAATRATAC